MGIIIRQSGISTILTYIGVVIGYVNILILFPKYMTPEEVGLARIIQDAAMLLVPLAQLGVSQLTLRFYPEFQSKKTYSSFVSLILGLTLITLTLFSLVFIVFEAQISSFFSSQSPEVVNYFGIILLLIWILAVHQVMVSLSQSALNIVLPNFLKEVWLRLLTLILLLLFSAKVITFDQFIGLLIGAYLFNLITLTAYLLHTKVLKISFKLTDLESQMIREMIKYGLITFLGASGILIIGKVDSLMVTGLLGLEANAIYTTAFYIAVLIELPKRAVAQISMPLISRSFEAGNLDDVSTIYQKSSLNNLIIGLLIFIGLWINLESLYSLIPRSEIYALGSIVVLIVGFGKLFDMAAGVNGEIIVMSKYYKVNVMLIVFLAIITISANLILIPMYGLKGAAFGSALALVLFNLAKYVFLWVKLKIQPISRSTLFTLLVGGIALLIGLYLPRLERPIIDIVYRSAIVTSVYAALIYALKLSPDINDVVNKFIGRQN